MNEITKQRADRCVTHHHACDCREYAHQQEVATLRREVELQNEQVEYLRREISRLENEQMGRRSIA